MNLRSLSAALSLAISLAAAQAGGFGGPPPFRNGSPLLTGIDGRYQAVASATNVTGIISFAIQNGGQTAGTLENYWIFFVDGNTLTGTPAVNISGGKINGVLDSGISNALDGEQESEAIIVIPGNSASGRFNGTIDLNSPVAAFNGKGVITGVPERTDQIVVIRTSTSPFIDPVVIEPIIIPGSSLPETKFKMRGTRLSTTVTNASLSTSGTSN